MPDPTTRDAFVAKARELLALRVDRNGYPLAEPAPAPTDTTPAEGDTANGR